MEPELVPVGQHGPVLLVDPGFPERGNAAGMVAVPVGQQHLDRGVGQGRHRRPHPVPGQAGVDEQGLVLPQKEERPHHPIIQGIEIFPQLFRL